MRKTDKHERHLANWRYKAVFEQKRCADLGEYFTYGICVTGGGYQKALRDISSNKKFVLHMVRLFNRLKLSPVHFKDAVEDFLP